MDKVKILRLCNAIEDIACDISQHTMNDIVSAESRMIFDKSQEIAAEISAQPKTNGDRIRAMSDEELAKFLNSIARYCREESCGDDCPLAECCACDWDWQEKWLKQEVSEDAR